jgi:hypothetical protein
MRFGAGRELLAVMKRSKKVGCGPNRHHTPSVQKRTRKARDRDVANGLATLGRGAPESKLIYNNRKQSRSLEQNEEKEMRACCSFSRNLQKGRKTGALRAVFIEE